MDIDFYLSFISGFHFESFLLATDFISNHIMSESLE